jgi:hypothetical protein
MKTVEFLKYRDAYCCKCQNDEVMWEGNLLKSVDCPEDHSGTYVLASEAKAEVDTANADWIERCRKFRAQDASEANERIKSLEDDLVDMFNVGPVCMECQRKDERIKVLEDALKDAIDSMDNDCDYEENHRSASEQARAALEVKP